MIPDEKKPKLFYMILIWHCGALASSARAPQSTSVKAPMQSMGSYAFLGLLMPLMGSSALMQSTHKHLRKIANEPFATVDSFPALLACGVLFEDLATGGGSSF